MVFGEDVTKDLWIPQFIDTYNHFMNGVDLANELCSYYYAKDSPKDVEVSLVLSIGCYYCQRLPYLHL